MACEQEEQQPINLVERSKYQRFAAFHSLRHDHRKLRSAFEGCQQVRHIAWTVLTVRVHDDEDISQFVCDGVCKTDGYCFLVAQIAR